MGTPKKRKPKPGTSRKAASERKLAFVREYLTNGQNGTQAAIAVGYSENSAAFYACQLLKDPKIQEVLEVTAKAAADANGLTVERTVREMCRLAFHDPRKMFDDGNQLVNIKELDDDTAAAISSIEVVEEFSGKGESRQSIGFTKKIRLHSKSQALDMLAKHQGLYAAEKHDIRIQSDVDISAAAELARERMKKGGK